MVMPLALALMGGAAYQGNKNRIRREAKEDEDATYMRKKREREDAEFQRQEMLRKELGEAYAPRAAQSAETYQPAVDDEGNAMPANPTAGTYKIDDQFGPTGARMGALPSMEAAQTAATAANQPRAQMQRVADAYGRAGMADKALTMRGMQRQDELGEMQLDQAREAKIDAAYNRDLFTRVSDFGSLESFLNESRGDGEDGAVKVKIVPTADGKSVQVSRVGVDGKLSPTPYTFTNDQQGLAGAMFMLSRGITPKDKLAHLQGIAKTDEDKRRWEAEFGLKKQEAGDRSMLRAAQAEAAAARAAALRAGGGGSGGGAAGQGDDGGFRSPEATFDSKTAAKIAEDRVKAMQEAATADGKPMSAQQVAAAYQEQFNALRSEHVRTEVSGMVRRALTKAESDPKQYAAEYDEALAMGFNEQALAQMGFKPPPGRQPAAAPAAPPAAPPAPQRQPVDRIGDGVIGMLTPMSMIQEAAAAGNPRAIKYLKDREQQRIDRDSAPRDTPSMLGLGA